MPLSSAQFDRRLISFGWLPVERWDADKLFNFYEVNGKYSCKICDEWCEGEKRETHIKKHVKQEKERLSRIKEENAEKRQEALAEARAERKLERETAKRENRPVEPKANKTKKSIVRVAEYEVITALKEALNKSGQATAVQLSEATGIDLDVIRPKIKKVPGIVVVDHVKSGGRGRPACIYGLEA